MSFRLLICPHPENGRLLKVMIAAAFAEVEVEIVNCQYGLENATKDYLLNCSPAGGYPVLQTDEGYIFESNAIIRHIARCSKKLKLYGSSDFQASQVDMWLDYSTTEVQEVLYPYLLNVFRGSSVPAEQIECVRSVLLNLDTWLENRTFLVGERLTVADIALACTLRSAYRHMGEDSELISRQFKNVFRFYNTVMQMPKAVEVLEKQGSSFAVLKVAKAKPVAVPAASKPVKEDEDDIDKEASEKTSKPANPLDLLPPSKFVLDAFKREYSNTDTRTVAAPYFFDNFDPEGYSAFWCKYKYNDENQMQFMTANFVRGWFQRMEHLRKYAFGISLIIGEEKKHEVVAFWVFRGKGLPAAVLDVVDTELFDWEEIKDIKEELACITDYLCWEGPTIPKPVMEGRCFK